ncbi:MAG: cadherin-like beta sandwich domain-containing protein [Clostridia bacterium]|nr:cadherin-like beta sandwich domain-containing protein [Clostridia bacterium]
MKKSIKILLFTLLILLAFGITNVKAATANISANKTSVNVGESVTITVNINAAAWDVKVNGSGITDSIVGYNGDAENQKTTKTYSLDTSSAGTYVVKISGNVTDANETKAYPDQSVTVTVNKPVEKPAEEPKPAEEKPDTSTTTEKPAENKPTTQEPKESSKSSNNKLKMLGIRPNDFKNFKPSVTTYYVTVPYETSEVEVYAEKQESSQKISGTGNESLKVGSNTVKVTCTAEDGTTKTYTMYITREEENKVEEPVEEQPIEETPVEEIPAEEPEKEEEPTEQKVLGITGLNVIAKVEDGKTFEPELMPVFNENEYEYQVAVPLTATEVEVNVEAGSQASIEVMGNKELKDGINNVTVMVKIGEDTKIYQIVVNKVEMKPTSALSDTLITQLAIIAAIATAIIVAIIALIIAIVRSKRKNNVEVEEEISETEENKESETENKEE